MTHITIPLGVRAFDYHNDTAEPVAVHLPHDGPDMYTVVSPGECLTCVGGTLRITKPTSATPSALESAQRIAGLAAPWVFDRPMVGYEP